MRPARLFGDLPPDAVLPIIHTKLTQREKLRRAHILKPNVGIETPSEWICYDTEAAIQKASPTVTRHTLRLGWAVYRRLNTNLSVRREEWFHFIAPKQFWQWVDGHVTSKRRLVLLAHNQQYDFLMVDGFTQLPRLGWAIRRPIVDTNIFIVKARKQDRSLHCLDFANIFPTSLEKIGKSIGIPKTKVDFQHATDEELSQYCKNDVLILAEACLKWVRWLRNENLGCFQPTLAAQAFHAFRHRFMSKPIYIHNNVHALALERASYRGGRTEVFQLGHVDGPIFELDVNSLYPSVMREFTYPVKLLAYHRRWPDSWPLAGDRLSNIIANATVQLDLPCIGVRRDKLIFPIGQFKLALTGPELQLVCQHGEILRIDEWAEYEMARIFNSYVDYFYTLRLQAKQRADVAADLMAKLLLNSLYGKFGQRQREVLDLGDTWPDVFRVEPVIDAQTGQRYTLQYYGGRVRVVRRKETESYNSFPAIASFVTAYARCKLWKYMMQAGLPNLFYADTDSLFTNLEGYNNLKPHIDAAQLGALRHKATHGWIYIWGAKDYQTPADRKLKGVRPTASAVDSSTYIQDTFRRIPGMLRVGRSGEVEVVKTVKRLSRTYEKGVVTSSGRVIPLRLASQSPVP